LKKHQQRYTLKKHQELQHSNAETQFNQNKDLTGIRLPSCDQAHISRNVEETGS
jgi:hypothetical protein